MKKRIQSLLLVFCMLAGLVSALSVSAAADGTENSVQTKEIDQSTYDELGLATTATDEGALSPYGNGTSQYKTGSEVYLQTNGRNGNRYTLRSGLDRMGGDWLGGDIEKGTGNLNGACAFYQTSDSSIKEDHGNTVGSGMSSNRGNVLQNTSNGWAGLYATSTAYDGGNGQQNCVAELQVSGENYSYSVNLQLYSIDSAGVWTPCGQYSFGAMSWVKNRSYGEEYDALFNVTSGDYDNDARNEIAVYCGQYHDTDGVRYADVSIIDSNTKSVQQTLSLPAGKTADYRDSDFLMRPAVTLASGDLDHDLVEDLAVAVSTPYGCSSWQSAGTYLFQKSGETTTLAHTYSLSLKNDDYAATAANVAFGNFTLPGSSVSGTALIMGGYAADSSTSHNFSKAVYAYAYYNYDTGEIVTSSVKTQSLSDRSKVVTASQKENMQYAPMPIACADLEGIGGGDENNEVLFGASVYTFNMDGGLADEKGQSSIWNFIPN